MKKFSVVIILLIFILALALASCKTISTYDMLDGMAKQQYSRVELEVTTKSYSTLKAKFTAVTNGDKTTISYSYDKVASIENVDGEYVIPEDYIVTLKGSVEVADGEVISQNGEATSVPIEQISKIGLNFKEAYFDNVQVKNNEFKANVINPKAFTGDNNLHCINMQVTVTYVTNGEYTQNNGASLEVKIGDYLSAIEITYTTDTDAEVTMTYSFAK